MSKETSARGILHSVLVDSLLLESVRTVIDDLDGRTSGITTQEATDSYKRRIELIYRNCWLQRLFMAR